MSHTPNFDTKIKAILDTVQPGERVCELTGEKWNLTEEEIGWYKKFNVPPSPYALHTRWELMTSFWTGFQWWYFKHPKTGENILSFYHPATGVSVLPDKEWFDHDFSSEFLEDDPMRSVEESLYQLTRRIPLPASSNLQEPENSIATVSNGERNSYFMCGCDSERSLFGFWSTRLVDSCLVFSSGNVTDSYSISCAVNVHNSLFIRDCSNVLSSAFCFSCEDIEFCFGATNQRHAKYLWFNEQLTKEAWEQRRAEVDLSRRSELEKWLEAFYDLVGNKTIWSENMSVGAINSTGEYLFDVSDCSECYFCVKHCSHLYNCLFGVSGKESAFSAPIFSENVYEANNCFNSNACKYTYATYGCQNLEYSFLNYECQNCFGCVGLRHKEFYIFNKSYTEEVYWKKLDEIKCRMLDDGTYGRSLSMKLSPTYFGESGAVKHLDAKMDRWEKLGGTPFDPESFGAIGDLSDQPMRSSQEIPDSIDEVTDEAWIGKPILDEKAHRRFTFLKPELAFYRRKRLAPPTTHMTTRMKDLLQEENLAVFENHACGKCAKQMRVAKNVKYPNRTIYCTACYLAHLETR